MAFGERHESVLLARVVIVMKAAEKKKLDSQPRREAAFIEPMECALVAIVPDGPQWVYEIKLDGYRAIAVKSGSKLALFSRGLREENGAVADEKVQEQETYPDSLRFNIRRNHDSDHNERAGTDER
jgi:ATP-dependent DNA ligase